MKITHGIHCNDYLHTPKAFHDRIIYRFVTNDNITPSSCTIRLGDTDPLTGEPITDIRFFQEYYRLVDHQVYVQNKETKDRLSLDGLTFDNGDDECERKHNFSIPAIDPFADEPEEISALKAFTASLDGYMADIYEWVLVKYVGGTKKLSLKDIADKWGVSRAKAYLDKDEMIRMIKETVRPSRE